jgi:hypothetical protein
LCRRSCLWKRDSFCWTLACGRRIGDKFRDRFRVHNDVHDQCDRFVSGYDVVLSGPSGQSTLASLNLIFNGDVGILTNRGIATVAVDIDTTLTGPGGAVADHGAIGVRTAFGATASGLLLGWPGPGPLFVVSTSSLMVDAGDLLTLSLRLVGQSTCNTLPLQTVASCSAAFGVDAFSFPTIGPVFNLPPGWTANSLDGSIVNNTFIPEPSTALLLSAGLVGLAVRRRNWRALCRSNVRPIREL